MLLLTFISALHCFLLSLVIYSGLPFSCSFVLFSIQCLVFVFVVASSIISWLVISLLRVSRTLLRPCLLMRRFSPVRLYSSRISFVLLFHILLSFIVIDLFSEGPVLWSILWACITLFFFIILSMGRYPVSWRRILVGVCCGRNSRVFSALFIMVCSCWSSVLVGSHPSAPYVSMGMIMESASCHTASICIPLNSLLPVSVMMFCVAAWIFFSSSVICADRFPLLFIISPRYL